MTFHELQKEIDNWIGQYEAGYWPPLVNLARLVEEVGELSRELNHRFGPKSKKQDELSGSIENELGDILFTVATLANSLEIDLEEVVKNNLEKVFTRDRTRWKRKEE